MSSIKNTLLCIVTGTFLSLACGDDESSKSSSDWKYLKRGLSDGEITSLALDTDSSGNPVIAYRDDANGSGLTVQKYVDSEWIVLGSSAFTGGAVSYVCLDVYGETPYVAFSDAEVSGKVTVMKFNGTSWELVGTQGFTTQIVYAGSSNKSDRLSLSVINDTEMYIAFIGIASEDGPYVYKYSGGSWSDITGGSPASSSLTHEVSISAESSTSVYAAYNSNHNCYLIKYNGTTWSSVGAGGGIFTTNGGRDISLKINGGIPYVAYAEIDGEYSYTGGEDDTEPDRALVKKYADSSWQQVGEIISKRTATEINLSFDYDSTPYICFRDWAGVGAPSVYKFNDNEWKSIDRNIMDIDTHYISMAVYDAKPVIALKEMEGKYDGKLTVMRFR